MKRFVLLVVPFLAVGTMAGQHQQESKSSPKAVSVSGEVSKDGKNLIAKTGARWSILNPEVLVGHEGQPVKIKGHISSGTHDILVLSVRTLGPQIKYAANPGDSAFRR